MDAMMKECMKPHALAHTLTGVGLGLVIVNFFPGLVSSALIFGIIVIVVGVAWDMMAQKSK